jgi:hypothetical protein
MLKCMRQAQTAQAGTSRRYQPSRYAWIVALPLWCKAIKSRLLPEYLRILALAQKQVQAGADYEAKITANLQRLAAVAKVPVSAQNHRSEVNKEFNFRVGATCNGE